MMSRDSEQLTLPLQIRMPLEVGYSTVNISRKQFLGIKTLKFMWAYGDEEMTRIDVEEIADFTDPNLRYALRFAAAAKSMGFLRDTEYSSHGQEVRVTATNEGADSRLLEAWYSGTGSDKVDTFMQDIHGFAQDPNENH
jgi:hypothetical protein